MREPPIAALDASLVEFKSHSFGWGNAKFTFFEELRGRRYGRMQVSCPQKMTMRPRGWTPPSHGAPAAGFYLSLSISRRRRSIISPESRFSSRFRRNSGTSNDGFAVS